MTPTKTKMVKRKKKPNSYQLGRNTSSVKEKCENSLVFFPRYQPPASVVRILRAKYGGVLKYSLVSVICQTLLVDSILISNVIF